MQVLQGVERLHEQNICHRDIKPQNILISGKEVKIIDFNSSVLSAERINYKRTGTLEFSAPEKLHDSYTNKVDLWACGIILYMLLVG